MSHSMLLTQAATTRPRRRIRTLRRLIQPRQLRLLQLQRLLLYSQREEREITGKT